MQRESEPLSWYAKSRSYEMYKQGVLDP